MIRALPSAVRILARTALLVTLGLAALPGATLERLSLQDMITQSTAIVRAKISGSYTAFSGAVIYTHYQIQVSETLKGKATVEFIVPGGVANNIRQTFS